jgi:hypothetical protein
MGLQNRVRDFNGLARKRLYYRYTIPTGFSGNFNDSICCSQSLVASDANRHASHGALRWANCLQARATRCSPLCRPSTGFFRTGSRCLEAAMNELDLACARLNSFTM